MKQLGLLVALSTLLGCSTASDLDTPEDVDKTRTLVLNCDKGLAKCYKAANKICGPEGFDEVSRSLDDQLTGAGRLEDQGRGRQVYREDIRIESEQSILTFRCR